MNWLDKLIEKLFAWLPPPNPADVRCPHCYGLGYDSSGYTCTCVKEKK